MAGKIKTEKKADEGKVLTFDNSEDYTVITLKSDGKNYVEHKHFAEKLVARKLAEYNKSAKIEDVKPNTKVIED